MSDYQLLKNSLPWNNFINFTVEQSAVYTHYLPRNNNSNNNNTVVVVVVVVAVTVSVVEVVSSISSSSRKSWF
jgi:uncharacterized membrane protein